MSNILKTIDLTDHAIRRAVFAVLDGLAAEHRGKCKGSDRLSTRGLARVLVWQFGLPPWEAQRTAKADDHLRHMRALSRTRYQQQGEG
jgi:hypothetical protein